MLRIMASSLIIALLCLSLFVFVSTTLPAKAQIGTIYINANGSINPSTANIATSDNVTYTFTGNNNMPIAVERSNIIINGRGYTLSVSGGTGFSLTGLSNATIKNTTITNSNEGILLDSSSSCTVSGNNITANGYCGIELDSSSGNSISGNNITANSEFGIFLSSSNSTSISGNNITANSYCGIELDSSSGNSISGNNIANRYFGIYLSSSNSTSISGNEITANSYCGVFLDSSFNNMFFHNNFINNTRQVSSDGSPNTWDNGYPSGGNYWSDYTGVDQKSGPYQNVTGSDGIGDTPYVIDANNIDRYPLTAPFHTFNVGTWSGVAYSVDIVSNSTTITNLSFNQPAKTLSFNVTGTSGTVGFCRVAIPLSLMSGGWTVTVNGKSISYSTTTDANYTYIYFTYHHSIETVQITSSISVIPEFQPSMLMPLFIVITLLGAMIFKRKQDAKKSK
jgi:parallel beta-helix repeat protein